MDDNKCFFFQTKEEEFEDGNMMVMSTVDLLTNRVNLVWLGMEIHFSIELDEDLSVICIYSLCCILVFLKKNLNVHFAEFWIMI